MQRFVNLAGALLMVTMLAQILACDSDNSTQPQGPDNETDYVVWMHNRSESAQLIAYHPATGAHDTLFLDFTPPKSFCAISASADGSLLFCTVRFDSIAVVSAADGSLRQWLPFPTQEPVCPSPDGQYLAIANQNLTVLAASDYHAVFSDTTRIPHFIRFSADSRCLYAVADGGPEVLWYVYRLDLTANPQEIDRTSTARPYFTQVVPTPDQSKWLLYLSGGVAGGLAVYDPPQDRITFEHDLCPGLGMIAVTPDGKYAFYTNPGGGLYPLGESLIRMFDIVNNRVVEEIVTNVHGDTAAPAHCPIQQMVVTPDGRYLVGLDYPGYNQLVCYDITKRELIDYTYFGESANISNLTVQLQP